MALLERSWRRLAGHSIAGPRLTGPWPSAACVAVQTDSTTHGHCQTGVLLGLQIEVEAEVDGSPAISGVAMCCKHPT